MGSTRSRLRRGACARVFHLTRLVCAPIPEGQPSSLVQHARQARRSKSSRTHWPADRIRAPKCSPWRRRYPILRCLSSAAGTSLTASIETSAWNSRGHPASIIGNGTVRVIASRPQKSGASWSMLLRAISSAATSMTACRSRRCGESGMGLPLASLSGPRRPSPKVRRTCTTSWARAHLASRHSQPILLHQGWRCRRSSTGARAVTLLATSHFRRSSDCCRCARQDHRLPDGATGDPDRAMALGPHSSISANGCSELPSGHLDRAAAPTASAKFGVEPSHTCEVAARPVEACD